MQTVFPLLVGLLLGVLVTRWLLSSAHQRALESYHDEGRYGPARRAVALHLRAHGTLNVTQLVRMTDIGDTKAQEYLERMVRDGFLKRHGHNFSDTFYTLT